MKLATWNVNSLKVRLPQVLEWLASRQPEVLCLQETKQEDCHFPVAELAAAGYPALFAGQKTYNGVAILSREGARDIVTALPGAPDAQARFLAATVGDVRVVCVYVPNGQSLESDKFAYKMAWLEALHGRLREEMTRHSRLAVLGDFNIAPDERDVYDPKAWEGQVLFSPREREKFSGLLALGLKDAFRLFDQPEKTYSWWDYRMNAFRRNLGLRIDHILLSESLARQCKSIIIDKTVRAAERPSDHAPVLAELA
jgi:exodeoxyribonuclease-3